MKRIILGIIGIWLSLILLPASTAAAGQAADDVPSPGGGCYLNFLVALEEDHAGDLVGLNPSEGSFYALGTCRQNELDDRRETAQPLTLTRKEKLVCGGVPGSNLPRTVILFPGAALESLPGAAFDQAGCAPLSEFHTSPAVEGLTPTALEIRTITARSRIDSLSKAGPLIVFLGFLFVTVCWIWMLHGRAGEAPSER